MPFIYPLLLFPHLVFATDPVSPPELKGEGKNQLYYVEIVKSGMPFYKAARTRSLLLCTLGRGMVFFFDFFCPWRSPSPYLPLPPLLIIKAAERKALKPVVDAISE